ncbi:SCO family protein [Aromatoleum diolicum]|uniref:Redoxin domain-containing protein n=1 Tax=Aromatoleum diolicum TaxID=75796 RepID=A0ABX1QB88_9RHOO|nr:SCO family protein [Aromatoleum diolicum]NMG75653.1 redoxin domain-containing protein [Aromatoleum diolicum]
MNIARSITAASASVSASALTLAVALALALQGGAAFAHGKDHPEAGAAAASQPSATKAAPVAQPVSAGTRDARAYFSDTLLLTQDGRQVKFYSDVLKDRVVLLNVVFTNCKDACPLITRKLKEVRAALGEPLASKVHFISISSDPEKDSPQALKAFAAKNEADNPNWTFLTGDKANVDFVLARLGQLGESPEGHSTLLIAGDVGAKRWNKIRPDAAPVAIAERLKMLADPVASAALNAGAGK